MRHGSTLFSITDISIRFFDGLNRWYVRPDEDALVDRLSVMPNVFDDYVPYRFQHRIDELEGQLARYLRLTRHLRALRRPRSAVARLVAKLERRNA